MLMQKPPGARQRYDRRLSTPSAYFGVVQVLTAFSRFGCWGGQLGFGISSANNTRFKGSRNVAIRIF
jgi:hypothetical protein